MRVRGGSFDGEVVWAKVVRVVETTNLLLKAVDKLDGTSTQPHGSCPGGPTSFREPSSSSLGTSPRLEMSRLFNWSGIGAK